MMARSATRSNQRPDTLMQDRSPPARRKPSCDARPDHTFGSNCEILKWSMVLPGFPRQRTFAQIPGMVRRPPIRAADQRHSAEKKPQGARHLAREQGSSWSYVPVPNSLKQESFSRDTRCWDSTASGLRDSRSRSFRRGRERGMGNGSPEPASFRPRACRRPSGAWLRP